jgi:hypothetical protein
MLLYEQVPGCNIVVNLSEDEAMQTFSCGYISVRWSLKLPVMTLGKGGINSHASRKVPTFDSSVYSRWYNPPTVPLYFSLYTCGGNEPPNMPQGDSTKHEIVGSGALEHERDISWSNALVSFVEKQKLITPQGLT